MLRFDQNMRVKMGGGMNENISHFVIFWLQQLTEMPSHVQKWRQPTPKMKMTPKRETVQNSKVVNSTVVALVEK